MIRKSFNLSIVGEYYRAGIFLRKIPAEYYKKLRVLTQKSPGRSKSNTKERVPVPRISININDESILSKDLPSDIITPSLLGKTSTPNKSFEYGEIKRPKRMLRLRQGSLGVDITNREKNLFLSPLEDYLSSRRATALEDLSSFFITNEVRREERSSGIMKIENERRDRTDWISRTNQLTQNINEYIARPENSLE